MTDAPTREAADGHRTIGEVAEELGLPQHVLRFWESRFPEVKPLKRAGGRRFYHADDVALLRAIKELLYGEGYTIKGVQRLLRDQGPRAFAPEPQLGSRRAAAPYAPDVPPPARGSPDHVARERLAARLTVVATDLSDCIRLLQTARTPGR